MKQPNIPQAAEPCLEKGPMSSLEKKYINEYLLSKGYRFENLKELPEEEAHRLMREACTYASLKLAEIESRARFRKKLHHGPET